MGAALATAACAPATQPPTFPIATGGAKFLTFVPDSLNDAGRAASVALDKDGNPVVSYLMFKAVLGPTDIPPAIRPGEPQPPAVMIASLGTNGLWNRTSVTPQLQAPRQGDQAKLLGGAFEIANDKGQPVAGVNTGLTLDGSGKHHVVWSTPTGVIYANDSSGSFSNPDTIAIDPAVGASIAVATDGTPWVSYITSQGAQVATKEGGAWKSEQVAAFTVNLSGTPALSTAIALTSNGDPVVTFGDGAKTTVATRDGGAAGAAWKTDTVLGAGGLAVSMALDKNGNPHVAYYDANGGVHHAHSLGGAPWTVSDLGTVPVGSNKTVESGWGTDIALDDQGVHYVVWADTAKKDVELATNAGGGFTATPVPNSQGGLTPSIGVSGDGKKLAVAWFDSLNKNLDVATASSGATLALAFSPSPASTAAAQPSASGSAAACQPEGGTSLSIAAPANAAASGFDKKCLAVAGGKAFTVAFKNDDVTIHNFVIYTTDPFPNQPTADQRLGGADTNGPVPGGTSQTYDVKALQPGTYFFRCDFHPTVMTGTFVVTK
jgi:plastocyanin